MKAVFGSFSEIYGAKMKKKALNLSLIPLYILIAVLYVLNCASAILAAIIKDVDLSILTWSIPAITVVFISFAIGSTLVFKRMKKRFDDSFDIVLSAYPSDKTEALKSLNDENPTPEQLSRWVSEQAEISKKAGFRMTIAKTAVENSSEIFWWIDGDRSAYYFGDYWSQNYGYHNLNKNGDIRSLFTDDTLTEFNGAIRRLEEGASVNFNLMGDILIRQHKKTRVRITAKIADLDDSHKIIVGTLHNMEEEDSLIRELESAKIREDFLLHTRTDIVYTVDLPDNKLKVLTPKAAKEMFGFGDLQDFDGGRRPYWQMIHPDYREGFIERFYNYNYITMLPERRVTYQYKIKTLNGSYIWVEHQAQVTAYSEGVVRNVIGRITDISNIKSKELGALYQTNFDDLTGALVFPAIKKLFDKEVGNGSPKAVLLFNINRFRLINNEYGYEFGNHVLRYFVSVLRENQMTRCQVGRVDSDLFVMTLLKADNESLPRQQIEELFEKFNETLEVENKMVNITLSAAASEVSDGKSFEVLYKQAETALAVCKNASVPYENSYEIYCPDMEDSSDKPNEQNKQEDL